MSKPREELIEGKTEHDLIFDVNNYTAVQIEEVAIGMLKFMALILDKKKRKVLQLKQKYV